MHFSLAIHEFVYSLLTSDDTIYQVVQNRIYKDFAPQTTDFPCIIFRQLQADTQSAHSGTLVLVQAVYRVTFHAQNGTVGAHYEAIKRMDELLAATNGVVVQGYRITSRREEIVDESERGRSADEHFEVIGGHYRITASRAYPAQI